MAGGATVVASVPRAPHQHRPPRRPSLQPAPQLPLKPQQQNQPQQQQARQQNQQQAKGGAYQSRRRNAIVPLPLLPPVPPNAVVVKRRASGPKEGAQNQNQQQRGRRRSSAGKQGQGIPFPSLPAAADNQHPTQQQQQQQPAQVRPNPLPSFPPRGQPPSRLPRKRSSPNFSTPPLSGGVRLGPVRLQNGQTVHPALAHFFGQPQQQQTPPGLNLPPVPSNTPPTPVPSNQQLPMARPRLTPGVRPTPLIRRHVPSPPPIPPKPKFHQPRISSPLAAPVKRSPFPSLPSLLHPEMALRPKVKRNKVTGGKEMRRLVIMNNPNGRRMAVMGVRLALEIWEAEECLESAMEIDEPQPKRVGQVEAQTMQPLEEDVEMEDEEDLKAKKVVSGQVEVPCLDLEDGTQQWSDVLTDVLDA